MDKRKFMKNRKKRVLAAVLLCCLFVVSFGLSGCGRSGNRESGAAGEMQKTTQTVPEAEAQKPYPYVFQPHVMSAEYKDKYGEEIEQIFYDFCVAALAGEESFPCPDAISYYAVFDIARSCLPVASAYTVIEENQPQNGIGKITYAVPVEEYKERVQEFKDRISWWITGCLKEGDVPFERVVSLYTALTNNLCYDYEALESSIDLSPYRALMEDRAICQEIAGAYVYLLLQTDVNACLCGALSRDMSNAHEWVMVVLDGQYYHMDPTFELDTFVGLRYFGMTDEKRQQEGDYPISYFNVAEVNGLDQSEYAAVDQRFAPLWNTAWYELDRERKVLLYYPVNNMDEALEFYY